MIKRNDWAIRKADLEGVQIIDSMLRILAYKEIL